ERHARSQAGVRVGNRGERTLCAAQPVYVARVAGCILQRGSRRQEARLSAGVERGHGAQIGDGVVHFVERQLGQRLLQIPIVILLGRNDRNHAVDAADRQLRIERSIEHPQKATQVGNLRRGQVGRWVADRRLGERRRVVKSNRVL